MPELLSTNEIVRRTGATFRQLQWWDERRVIQPANREKLNRGQGHARWYNYDQAMEILVVANLRRRGVSLQAVRRILARLRREFSLARYDHRKAGYNGNDWYLLTDYATQADVRRRIFRIEHDAGRILQILKDATYPVLVVALSEPKETAGK